VIVIFAVEPEHRNCGYWICPRTFYAASQDFVSSASTREVWMCGWWCSSGEASRDYEAFPTIPPLQSLLPKLCEFRLPVPRLWGYVSQAGCHTFKISQGSLILLAEFRMKPENQQRLVELEEIHNDEVAASRLNFTLNSTVIDVVRTMNYGQYFRKFWGTEDPKYAPLNGMARSRLSFIFGCLTEHQLSPLAFLAEWALTVSFSQRTNRIRAKPYMPEMRQAAYLLYRVVPTWWGTIQIFRSSETHLS